MFGVLVDAPDAVGPARQESAAVVRAASGGRVAIEAIVPADDPPQRQRRVLDRSVLLWELDDRTERAAGYPTPQLPGLELRWKPRDRREL